MVNVKNPLEAGLAVLGSTLIVDEVVALLGGKDARLRFVQRVEKGVVLPRKQLVAEIVGRVAPHRHADRVELAVDRVVVDELAARGLVHALEPLADAALGMELVFDTASGGLYYDADGTGQGADAQLIVTLTGVTTLAATDIVVL